MLAVIIVYTIIQQFEGNVLIPFVMNKTLGLNPLLVFVCLLFGGVIMGVLGIVLAVPIAVIVSIIFEYSHKEQQKKEEEI
ncbi:MAG: AI-2E family transporter [Candidatus Peribacteria bacterium]|nr:AI-2E family transporter [Candidatus Peribacteria bacterium]